MPQAEIFELPVGVTEVGATGLLQHSTEVPSHEMAQYETHPPRFSTEDESRSSQDLRRAKQVSA